MSDAPEFGEKEFAGVGFPTPVSIPDETVCRSLTIPADGAWLAVVMGCLWQLADERRWQQYEGGITREEAAARAQEMLFAAYDEESCAIVQAPYWDDDSGDDADDEAPAEGQPWYGILVDDNLSFVENVGFWVITGFVAIAATPAAAIAFVPIARKFTIAFQKHDLGGIVRAFVDGAAVGQMDTYSPTDTVGEMTILMPVTSGLMMDDDPPALWVEMADEVNPEVDGDPTIRVIRKRLSEADVTPANIRYNSDCDCVQMTPDDGVTWNTADGSDPRKAPAFLKPHRTGADRRCDAAANMVAWLKAFIDRVIEILEAGAVAFVVANEALGFFALLFFEVGALVELIIDLGSVLFGIGGSLLDAAFTSDQYDLLLCIFFCAADTDGQINADGFLSVQAQVAAQLNATAAIVVGAILGAQGNVGLSNAGAIGTETGDCSDCDTCGWCYRFNDTHRLGDWVSESFNGAVATYDGTQWNSAVSGDTASIWISWTLGSAITLTDASVLAYTPFGRNIAIFVNGDGGAFTGTNVWFNGFTVGTPYPVSVDRIDVYLITAHDASGGTISSMQFSGTDEENPFGDNDC